MPRFRTRRSPVAPDLSELVDPVPTTSYLPSCRASIRRLTGLLSEELSRLNAVLPSSHLSAARPCPARSGGGNGSLVRAIQHATRSVPPPVASEAGIYRHAQASSLVPRTMAVGDRGNRLFIMVQVQLASAITCTTGVHQARAVFALSSASVPYLARMRGMLGTGSQSTIATRHVGLRPVAGCQGNARQYADIG